MYWAFISYSSSDVASAKWLQRALERYRVPRHMVGRATPVGPAPPSLRPIFRDRTDLPADADLKARIDAALEGSAYLIVICSPLAAASRWVNEEITRFRELHGRERILAVIVGGDPVNAMESCFPPALLSHASEGGTARFEPIAADLRPGGDGRRLVRLKLVAGMLGAGLDELIRRDDRRRQRRLVGITVASVAGMAMMGALAAAALWGRNEAQRQRAHAEGLIEFMLTDLRKRLEPGGHLDLMDGAGRQALKYYEAQSPGALDAASLARRARALRLVGEIRLQRGDLNDALNSFEQASATTAELLDRAPKDGAMIFNHAQNVFWVGEIARQRGDSKRAESSFRDYLALAERLVSLDPGNDEWRAEVDYAQNSLGVVLLQEGRAAEATAAFRQDLAIAQVLAQRHPDDVGRQLSLGQAHAWLADALQRQGRLAETRAHREAELALYDTVLAKDPTLRQAKFSVIVARQTLGRLAMIQGDLQAALSNFIDCVARGEALLVNERENMDLTSVVAIAQVDLGDAQLAAGRTEAARSAQQRAAALLAAALAHDSSVALWRYYNDCARLLEAALRARGGEHEDALRIDQELISHQEQSKDAVPSTDRLWLLERARLQVGDDLAALGRMNEARAAWSAIADSLKRPLDSYEPRLLLVLKVADQRLAREPDLLLVTQRLDAMSRPQGPR